ncbi:sensor histidine kinase [Sporolactobacillus pectinivorans]|uniref:sensor histidine kinase n=1 Tax=Sporolactobacillus pectinivorans TaxID=1591408 RepID=UPI000C26B9CF|nr:GHKL domain-containing protein [Sporolactobacillus pectinivorans]
MIYLWILVPPAAVILAAILYRIISSGISRHIDKRIAGYQNDLLAKHYEEVQNIYMKMRGWRHDYHNHIQVMKAHLAMEQLDELKDYLDMLDHDLQTVDTVIKTGNIRLDAILNSKLSLMAVYRIKVNAKAQVPASLSVNEYDLCSIIGNLLDNAMEGCEKVTQIEDRFIRIYIGVFKGQLYISVTNSAGEMKKIRAGNYLTTKGNGHGFGLKRIDTLVKKYHGYLNRQNEPGVFATEVMLPL